MKTEGLNWAVGGQEFRDLCLFICPPLLHGGFLVFFFMALACLAGKASGPRLSPE